MNKKTRHTITLGIFVTLGLLIFILAIYLIGSKQNLFGSNTKVSGIFHNVSGLRAGNNIRFSGINVGTVESVEIISDSLVRVSMLIEKDAARYIKKDSEASIGSEGLMGDKIIAIAPGSPDARSIADGDELRTKEPMEMDQLMAQFTKAGEQASKLLNNLQQLSSAISEGQGLAGHLITDTSLVNRFDQMMFSFEKTGANIVTLSRNLEILSNQTLAGKNTLGKLMTEDSIAVSINHLLDSLQATSDKAVKITSNLEAFTEKLNNERGTMGRLLTDTSLAENIEQTLHSAQNGIEEVTYTAERVNRSRLFSFLFGSGKNEEGKKGR